MKLRVAGPPDAAAVAGLHADSWRRHYRGAYADSYLDSAELGEDRRTVWTEYRGGWPVHRSATGSLGGT